MRHRMTGFFIIAALILHWSGSLATSHSLIDGPDPMTVVAPIGAVVTFTCAVNTTELTGSFQSYSWIVDGEMLSGNIDQEDTNGALVISTLQRTVEQDYITGVIVQCEVVVRESNTEFMVLRSNNATLTAYGPPEAPSNLTSTQSSSNALILSWSAPSSPVQLHYTVTVRLTNTNSTSTTTITMFNTSSTTITISRDNITGNSTDLECDIYLFTVTAINPAGSSIPANHTSPLTVLTAPTSVQSDICISNQSNCATVNFMAYSCTSIKYRIVVQDTCNDTAEIITIDDQGGSGIMRDHNVPYTTNCTNITIIAKNSVGMSPNHSVNATSADYCTRPVQMCPLVTSSQNLPTMSPTMGSVSPGSSSSVMITIIASSVAGVLVLIVVLSLILIGVFIYCKVKRNKGESTINNTKEPPSELGKMTLPSTIAELQTTDLTDYADPIDAKRDMEKYKSLNSGVASRKQEPFHVTNQQQPLYAAIGPASASNGVMNMEVYSDPWQQQKPASEQHALESPLFHRKSNAPPPSLPARPPSLASRPPSRSPSRPASLSSHPPSLPSRSPSRPPSLSSRPTSLSQAPPLPPPLLPPGQEYAVLNHGHTKPTNDSDQDRPLAHYSSINKPPSRLPKERYSQLQFHRNSNGGQQQNNQQ